MKTELNYCADTSCDHGSCENDFDAMGYTCSCNQGWVGRTCSQCNISNCEECTGGDPPECETCEDGLHSIRYYYI